MKRMHQSFWAGLIAVSALCSASCGGGQETPATTGEPGKAAPKGPQAPDFTLPSLEGGDVHLSDYLGKNVILLDFWSTTCAPCMVEMPHLVELYKQHRDKGFIVLAISLDGPESRAQVSNVVHDKQMTFPVLLDEETTVVARYNPKRELPFAVLIGRDGTIAHKRGGYNPGDEKSLTVEVEKTMASP